MDVVPPIAVALRRRSITYFVGMCALQAGGYCASSFYLAANLFSEKPGWRANDAADHPLVCVGKEESSGE